MDNLEFLKSRVRDIPDFPKRGILFRDITTLIKDAEALRISVDMLYEQYKDKGITKVIGIESRGFILGSILAYRLNAGFVPIRKKGKLPSVRVSKSYQLEYGMDSIEMHVDAVTPNDKVLLHDDLLATGGTTVAAVELLESVGVTSIDICFLMELTSLEGRKKIPHGYPVSALLSYE